MNNQQIESLKEFEKDWDENQGEEDIKLLKKSKQRHQLLDKGLSKISKIQFNKVFNEFRRDVELLHIGKAVQHTPASLTGKQVATKKIIEKKSDESSREPNYNSQARQNSFTHKQT